jgi:hypothetical protein
MRLPENRSKVSQSFKSRGYAPRIRGGNGQLSVPQQEMLARLGEGWIAELAIPVASYRTFGLPKHLKIDLANPHARIAIELDGSSHNTLSRREQDRRKTLFLAQSGWCIFRITNQRATELSSTCKSADILLTSLMAFSPTTAT